MKRCGGVAARTYEGFHGHYPVTQATWELPKAVVGGRLSWRRLLGLRWAIPGKPTYRTPLSKRHARCRGIKQALHSSREKASAHWLCVNQLLTSATTFGGGQRGSNHRPSVNSVLTSEVAHGIAGPPQPRTTAEALDAVLLFLTVGVDNVHVSSIDIPGSNFTRFAAMFTVVSSSIVVVL